MHKKTIKQLFESLKKKEFSSVELVQHFLNRIKKSKTNSFISITEEKALKNAKIADIKNSYKNTKFIYGIPFAHKDVFCVKKEKTTCSSKMLQSYIPTYNSTIHQKLIQKGFILLGKTNMDEFCMGCTGEKSIYKNVKNPWNYNMCSGGSSSGSAASVAECLTPVATGSDTGGSVRQPAAFCGITGLKPTYGLISRHGLIAYASSLDHCGILAKTAEDCEILLNIIKGFDKNDLTTIISNKYLYTDTVNYSVKNIIVGIPREFFLTTRNIDIMNVWKNTIKLLQDLKIKIKFINLDNTHLYTTCYRAIVTAECTSNLARYDSIKFNPTNKLISNNLNNFYSNIRSNCFGTEIHKRILLGSYLLTKYNKNTYYEKALTLRKKIIENYTKIFQTVNTILLPTTISTATMLGKKNNEIEQIKMDKNTCAANLTGMPAITFPVGLDSNGLPIGMQLIANKLQDNLLLTIVQKIQKYTDWHNLIFTIKQV